MQKLALYSISAVLVGSAALTACGRNPGARERAYPGMEKIEEAMAAAQPRCVSLDPKRLRATVSISGKEKFTTDRKGIFKLDSYEISKATDRADRSVPNGIYTVTEFEDFASAAPRLAIDSKCVDLKGAAESVDVAPVTRIDSSTGLILESQPFSFAVSEAGKMSAESRVPVPGESALPAGKVPEAALLLGKDYAANYKTLAFAVSESEDGSLNVKAEFVGMDANLSRLFIRVEAVYGWDSAE
ncbi:MAG: hypothetical protein JST04_12015 [Bdellovibrionales bacterium]|nr:hypothetical protein [Bdellovibrionales bacterium]